MVFDSDDSDSDCNPQEDGANTGVQHEDQEDCPWRSAVDPNSGRTYYYHVKTRETQWRKPMEMASREERDAIEAKEKRQKEFFAAMEANIIKSITAGMKAPEKKSLLDEEYEDREISEEPLATPAAGNQQSPHEIAWVPPANVDRKLGQPGGAGRDRPDLVRTISTMDTSVLRELIKRVPSSRNVRAAPPGINRSQISMGSNHSTMSNSNSRSMSGRSLGGSSHQSNRQRRITGANTNANAAMGTPSLGAAARKSNSNFNKSTNDDSEDELPPLTVVTTPDLKSEMKRMGSLKLENLQPERANSLRLDQLQFEDGDSKNLMDSNLFEGSNGLNFALSNHSFQLDPNDSTPALVNHNSRSQSSFAGANSFSSFDSDNSAENNNSMGAHLSISSSLHPVEEGMDESDKSLQIRADPKEIVLDGRDFGGDPSQENSFSLGAESDTKDATTANWLDELPQDDEDNKLEELVGYGDTAKPFKDAGYTSFFDESMANFDLSEKETQALQKLALISEQMAQVMELEDSEEEEEDDFDEDDEEGVDDDFNETNNRSFELNFEEEPEGELDTEESSIDNDEPAKSSPSFQTPITSSTTKTSGTSGSSGSPTQPALRRTLGAKNMRVPRKLRNKLPANGEESEGSSSQDGSTSGNLGVASLAGATLTTDNPRSHAGPTLTTDNARSHLAATLTTDNARSHFGAPLKGEEGNSSSSLNNVSGHSQDTMSSSKKRSAVRLPSLGRMRSTSSKGGLSLGSPRSSWASPMSSSARSQKGSKRDMSKRPDLIRRNTCGTLYVGTTMSAPDKDATIKCVCGVYRAHILQSEMAEEEPDWTHFRIFNDLESQQGKVPKNAHRSRNNNIPIPSLDDITTFYRDVFQRAQMEYDCIIISLIYVERLIKTTYGALRPRACNWRSILFSCMVLSSKVWDDLSMWNADFSQTCPSGIKFPLKRINELEVAILSALSYKVKVPASEYAKYYFLLRTMLIKSGLVGDSVDTASPLDVEGAKRLQQVSTQYQSGIGANKRQIMRKAKSMRSTLRSKSMGEHERTKMGEEARKSNEELRSKVSLEHVVHM